MSTPALPVFSNPWRQWLAGGATLGGVFLLMWAYHDWWRAKPCTMATANEALALAAYACLGLCLVAAPLQRLLGLAEERARMRRPFALAGAGAAGMHLLLSLVAAPGLAWIWKHPLSAVLGCVAALLVAALAATSFASPARRLGAGWAKLHLLAVPAFVLVTLHVLVLGKADKWVAWWTTRDLPMPPGTLPMAALGLLVLGVRVVDALHRPEGRRRRLAIEGGGLALVVGVLVWTWPPSARPPATVAAMPVVETVVLCGSSMRVPIEAIVAQARQRGVAVRVDFGGSETILPRLLAGERADVAVLHDPFPARLAEAGLLAGRLDVGGLVPVLITPPGNPLRLADLADLGRDGLRLGLPDARYSTCGEYVRDRLRREGLAESVSARVIVEHRQHMELVNALRVGAIDAAVVWNFVANPQRPAITVLPLPGPWPETTVAVCTLRDGRAGAERLLGAAGGEAAVRGVFTASGFATP